MVVGSMPRLLLVLVGLLSFGVVKEWAMVLRSLRAL